MTRTGTMPLWLLIAVLAISCWDAWRWTLTRLWASPEEALPLCLALVLVVGRAVAPRLRALPDSGGQSANDEDIASRRMAQLPALPFAGLLAAYALSFGVVPPILRAALAFIMLIVALDAGLSRRWPPIALYGVIALALPVLPSLQFVLGYPMRIISASMTATLLRLQGLGVERQGTYLQWRGETVQFDAPCSGVTMLWAAIMLTLAVCLAWRSGMVMTVLAVLAALVLTIAANVLRTASLFYIETGIIAGAPPWWHTAIGLVSFALAASGTIAVLARLQRWESRWVTRA